MKSDFSYVLGLLVVSAAFGGCKSSTECSDNRTDSLEVPAADVPVIELAYDSPMIRNMPRTKIYANGTVYDCRFGTTNVSAVGAARVNRTLAQLKSLGFFSLSEEAMASKIEKADTNWDGQKMRHALVMVDASTVCLTAQTGSRENRISVAGLRSHMREYPWIEEFKTLADCVAIVENSVLGQHPNPRREIK